MLGEGPKTQRTKTVALEYNEMNDTVLNILVHSKLQQAEYEPYCVIQLH